MKDFSRGVAYYTEGIVKVGFPEDDVCCRWCPLLRVELKTDRSYCGKTGEYLAAPNFTVGNGCPIIFEEKENETWESPS